MPKRFIDKFDVLLLDMGRTFMFDVDRFSDADDFAATYRRIGGSTLSDGEVGRIISTVFDTMLADSRNPNYYDRFPSVLSYLKALPVSQDLPQSEIRLLEYVFALHEIGTVPDTHVEALRRLHETHRLGVVSNIWSKSDLYVKEFKGTGIHELFEVLFFSSDHGRIKPSPSLFLQAIAAFAVDQAKIVFVGDSLKQDIAGAKAVGLSAVWIGADVNNVDIGGTRPDLVVQDLRELLEPYEGQARSLT